MKAKIVKITEEKYRDRISLETCKKVLNAKENGYTDEQVYKIRDMLYALADIDFQICQEDKNKATIIELNTVQDETQSNSLHSGVNRRAS